MRLLDLFCGAGGAAMGYYKAGFEVIGIDITPQPNYPFRFIQADAITFPLIGYDAIHASPPCQAYSSLRGLGKQAHKERVDLVAQMRARLRSAGVPYVIENVVGAPLVNPIVLCGSHFGLRVRRHRLFESNVPLVQPQCAHKGPALGVWGDHPQSSSGKWKNGRARSYLEACEAMGIGWMPWKALTQAIPPAYTEYVGRSLLTPSPALA